MATGARPMLRDERKILVDALRRAAADTRTVIQTWREHMPKAIADADFPRQQAETITWLEKLLAAQEHLAAELADARYELRLVKRSE